MNKKLEKNLKAISFQEKKKATLEQEIIFLTGEIKDKEKIFSNVKQKLIKLDNEIVEKEKLGKEVIKNQKIELSELNNKTKEQLRQKDILIDELCGLNLEINKLKVEEDNLIINIIKLKGELTNSANEGLSESNKLWQKIEENKKTIKNLEIEKKKLSIEIKEITEKLKKDKEVIMNEHKILAKRQKDLEIYEKRLRKHNPYIIL